MVMGIRTAYARPEARSNPEANARCSILKILKDLPMQAGSLAGSPLAYSSDRRKAVYISVLVSWLVVPAALVVI